jgi:hypothetical protein
MSCVTHWWLGGKTTAMYGVLRFYVDGETKAAIETKPLQAVGVTQPGTMAFAVGKMGMPSQHTSVYSNLRIPFRTELRITLQLAAGVQARKRHEVFFSIRGAEGLRVQMAEVQLPETAKLRLHHFWAKDIRPLQYKELVHVHGQGLLFLTMVNMHSGNDFFLEGCMRARVDGTQTLLSSGTEDYFLRSFYFDTVPLASDASGVLQWKKTATKRVLTAYRFHDTELITFNSSFTLVWRNGEVNNTQGLKCVDGEEGQGHIIGNPTTTLLNANIWFYEW